MTQEEKARAYDEALKIARKSWFDNQEPGYKHYREFLESMFPELAESEDERIRKWLVDYFTETGENWIHREFTCKQIVDYLEKQKEQKPAVSREEILHQLFQNGSITLSDYLYLTGEQKPAGWKPQSEALEALMYAIEGKWEMIKPTSYLSRRLEDLYEWLVNNFDVDETLIVDKDIEELKALNAEIDASMEQKPTEWSEEDEDMLNSCISSIEEAKENRYAYKETDGDTSYDHEIAWLKSLRPSWKPSEEQMEALRYAVALAAGNKVLAGLYEQLNKL